MKRIVYSAILLLVAYFLIFDVSCFAEQRSGKRKPTAEEQKIVTKVEESAERFGYILFCIARYYYKKIDIEKCAEQIIQKGVSGATDRYSRFITKEEVESSILGSLSGRFVGIGIRLSEENGEIKVHSVFANSPAEKAGILSGDVITAVSPTGKKEDLIPVSGLEAREVINLVMGEKGSKVLLSISRNGQSINIEAERKEIKVESVISRNLTKKIGYVKIISFIEPTRDDFKTAVLNLKKNGAEAFVIDLRDNPGGLLQSVVGIISFFKNDQKPIIYEVDQNDVETGVGPTKKIGTFKEMKMVVLVNKNTASAAEIMSGWLKEEAGITVIGEATYGKDCGQSSFGLPTGDYLYLTTFKYLIGEKKVSIGKTGVIPTIEIKNSDDPKDKTDYQLQKALEITRELIVH